MNKVVTEEKYKEIIDTIENNQREFEQQFKDIFEKYIEDESYEDSETSSNDFLLLFNFSSNYTISNIPYAKITTIIFNCKDVEYLPDFINFLKYELKKLVTDRYENNEFYKKDINQVNILSKIIEHTQLAINQKISLHAEQEEKINNISDFMRKHINLTSKINKNAKELVNTLEKQEEKMEKLNTDIKEQEEKIEELNTDIKSNKFDLIALMSVVFTIFTVLGVNASIISAIATIKDLNICKMIGLFAFGNITLAIMICCIMKFSKKYYMDFINNRN